MPFQVGQELSEKANGDGGLAEKAKSSESDASVLCRDGPAQDEVLGVL